MITLIPEEFCVSFCPSELSAGLVTQENNQVGRTMRRVVQLWKFIYAHCGSDCLDGNNSLLNVLDC